MAKCNDNNDDSKVPHSPFSREESDVISLTRPWHKTNASEFTEVLESCLGRVFSSLA